MTPPAPRPRRERAPLPATRRHRRAGAAGHDITEIRARGLAPAVPGSAEIDAVEAQWRTQ
ncbi:hypothetical protein ACFPM7_14560 [Actinokineospora guangxiensis]|uniref:Uncharacterized protein n=1 Tax=Actinokineospora guangxiensis TaxID=1490288 RepID=A0ABW0ELK4_9PSEU